MEKKIERIGLGGAGYYDSKTNTFVIIKQPFGKNFNLKQIVTYMNENGFTTYGNRPIKPDIILILKQCISINIISI